MLNLRGEEIQCAYCIRPPKFICSRCRMDSYCSQKCQIEDFSHHRYICFPLPDLIPIAPTTSDDTEKLDVKDNETQLDRMEKNQLVKSKSNNENDVLEQQSDMIKNVINIKQNDTVLGTLSVTSSFEDVTSDDGVAGSQQSNVIIKNLMNLRISENFKEDLQLIQPISLKKSCHNIISGNSDKFFTIKTLNIREWPKSKNIKVKLQTIVQPPNIISFIEDKKLIESFYDLMEKEIQKYQQLISDDNRKYLPKENEIVLGHYDGTWNRAVVLDSDPKGIIVLFIDYGNMDILLPNEIIRITNEYFIKKLSFEVCSRQFIVDNVPAKLDNKQQEILDSKAMMITNLRVDEKGFSHCEIFGF